MRAWLEIDMDNLKYNLNKIKELVQGTNVLGVIKANSYGFGAIETAKELAYRVPANAAVAQHVNDAAAIVSEAASIAAGQAQA